MRKEAFSLKGVVLAKFFNLNCILKVGNCPFIISEMKNSFHSKLLLISQFQLMRVFFHVAEHKTLQSYQNEAVLIAPIELFFTLCL